MAYELLFSSIVSSDRRIVFSDHAIVASSVMVEISALDVDVRRVAGWIYPVIVSSPSQYERQDGKTLLFGRTRLNIPALNRDVFLELFPQYGLKAFIVSVFSGMPESNTPPPPSVQLPNGAGWITRSGFTRLLMHSMNQNGPFVEVSGWPECVGALVRSTGQIWFDLGYPNYSYAITVGSALSTANYGNWEEVRTATSTLVIPTE